MVEVSLPNDHDLPFVEIVVINETLCVIDVSKRT